MTLSNGKRIGFDNERIVCLLVKANQKKYCPIAARIIAALCAE